MDRARLNNVKPAVLLIDGQCLLCNTITHFVIKRDKRGAFRFAMLQSSIGKQLLIEGKLPINDIDTFVLIQGDRCYTKSDAALRVFRKLDGWWRIWHVFIIIPLAWRNLIYDIIARNRYRLFGKADVCLLPTPELRARFMDDEVQAAVAEEITDEK